MLVIGSAKPRHTPHHFATPESPNSHSVFTYPGTFTLRTLCQRHLVDIYKRLSFPFCCLLFRASSYEICWTRCPVVLQSPALTPSHNPLRYGDLTLTFGVPLSASRINDPYRLCPLWPYAFCQRLSHFIARNHGQCLCAYSFLYFESCHTIVLVVDIPNYI